MAMIFLLLGFLLCAAASRCEGSDEMGETAAGLAWKGSLGYRLHSDLSCSTDEEALPEPSQLEDHGLNPNQVGLADLVGGGAEFLSHSEGEVSEEGPPEFSFHLPTSQEIEEAMVKWPEPVPMPVVPGRRVYRPVRALFPAPGSSSDEEDPINVLLRTAFGKRKRSDSNDTASEPKKPRG